MARTIAASLPREKQVCGCTVRRMPVGAYLEALEMVSGFPKKMMEKWFQGQSTEAVLKKLGKVDKQTLYGLIMEALAVFPKEIVALFAKLSGIDEEKLHTDADIGLSGLAELMLAWWEVNDIENFTQNALLIKQKIQAVQANIGCKR